MRQPGRSADWRPLTLMRSPHRYPARAAYCFPHHSCKYQLGACSSNSDSGTSSVVKHPSYAQDVTVLHEINSSATTTTVLRHSPRSHTFSFSGCLVDKILRSLAANTPPVDRLRPSESQGNGDESTGHSRFTLAYLRFVWPGAHTVSILCTLYSSAGQL